MSGYDGGLVSADHAPVWLHPRETVVTPQQARRLRVPNPDADLERDTRLWNRLLRRLSTKRHRHRRNHRKAKG